jgi:hypothetical protein
VAPRRRWQVAGHATVVVTLEEMKLVVLGWSVKHKLLDHDVHSDKNQKIGKIDDIMVSPKKTASWAIIIVRVRNKPLARTAAGTIPR